MKRVAIDCRLIDGGGIGRYLRALIDQYRKLAPPFALYLLGHPEQLKQFSFTAIIPFKCPIYSLSEQLFFPSVKVDLLHCPHYNIPLFYKGKIVTTIHDVAHIAVPHFFAHKLARIYAKFMLNRAVRKSAKIITVSNFSLDELHKFLDFSPEKAVVIYNGVDSSMFYRRSESEINDVRARLGIKGKYALYVGNMKPHKNVQGVIEAFRLLKGELDTLVLVGKSKGLRSRFKGLERVQEANIIFVETIPDELLPALYSGAELLLFPSFYEGFGLPPLEALACGTPSVVSDLPFARETLCDAAIFVDPSCPEKIAEGALKLLHDENIRRKILRRKEEILSRFSWETTAKKTLRIYEEAIGY